MTDAVTCVPCSPG